MINRTGTRCWLPGGPNNVFSLCSAESLKPNQIVVIPRSFSYFFLFHFVFSFILCSSAWATFHFACGLPRTNAAEETNMLNSCEYLAQNVAQFVQHGWVQGQEHSKLWVTERDSREREWERRKRQQLAQQGSKYCKANTNNNSEWFI